MCASAHFRTDMNPGPRDVLSQLLAACKAERAVTASFRLHSPWALHSAGTEGALIRVCTGQGYWIHPDGGEPIQIGPRDIVMLPRGTPHTVASMRMPDPNEVVAFADVLSAHMTGRHGDHPIEMTYGDVAEEVAGVEPTQLYTLHLWMPALDVGSIQTALPPVIVLRSDEHALAHTLAVTMELLVQDSLAQLPGWELSAARMGDLLLVRILSEFLRAPDAAQPGLSGKLSALDDPGIARAIAAMQEAPQRDWTIPGLAAVAYLSRTVFTERFRALIGVPPMQYLSAYRMNVAAERLRQPRARIGDVAESVGYASEKAFARAFQRWIGVSPAQYQRDARGDR
ncbi:MULTISPECIES: AraC family transcriptional regulator [Pandoraea]|uniref:AraC family transcriptional regulator n=1 Tax=Pandoraea TaxID=93217 RepID=UPI001F5DC395|nr:MULTISPECIES: AraC family transcriptional regulator [Pandoraea]